MPRTARASLGNWCYHVLNRGNARAEVFHKDEDYAAFLGLFEPACERLRMRILGYCLMPNHFHLVQRPYGDGDLGRWNTSDFPTCGEICNGLHAARNVRPDDSPGQRRQRPG